ncbi:MULTISPECIES: MarR family winged helix-turn-helix transcriptional regulator [Rossellomorea]|jgi:MarR family transcriptional regulator, organic hydroperoxide resistance regulator|uniref:MarR family winged helix-turn-helix transcriptional regulator n=1 Tax=Rossellomorea TaxID=2837508 RepID=UPI0011E8A9BA|nr:MULTISPECIES: MarR family transcriptional regulator [Rossellomorea]MDT9026276.1 MarR family transcriptional regulator [Rossellomorea sp. YC4-1]TYS89125.1 MarR family transcriptional regulator [Rossellomorea aquimaris]
MKDPLLLENQICFKIYTAEREITKLYRGLLEEIGVTYPQYLALLVLWEDGTVSVKELGRKLFLDSGTLTPMLKRMESNGLVERHRSVEDERSVVITLTKKGIAMKEKAACVPARLLERLEMDGEELERLDQTLTTILGRLQG